MISGLIVVAPVIDTADCRVWYPAADTEKLACPAAVAARLYVPSALLVADHAPTQIQHEYRLADERLHLHKSAEQKRPTGG
jgi:hypothetical protein